MTYRPFRDWLALPLITAVFITGPAMAQPAASKPDATSAKAASEDVPPSRSIEIPVEPKFIDPGTVLPPKLTAPVTVEFSQQSLREIVEWIESAQKIKVILDQKAIIEDVNVITEQISESLNKEPLYLLLDRLRALGLDWYVQDGNLHITTEKIASNRLTTQPYNLGDLIDTGFKSEAIKDTILSTVNGEWAPHGTAGPGVVVLGDVMFVRQTARLHREVAGVLAGLRKHGRRTFVNDTPRNDELRQKLYSTQTVNFKEVSLASAVLSLAKQSQVDIRLDTFALKTLGIRDRTPISLSYADQKLSTILDGIVRDLNLNWVLWNGIVWITSQKQADGFMKIAIFNVSDLSRDESESRALEVAIETQTSGPWRSPPGKETGNFNAEAGELAFAAPGVLVIRQTERELDEVMQLLDTYRTALRGSKARKPSGLDPQEVLTRYYKVPTVIAEELITALPQMVHPKTWTSKDQPKAVGSIIKMKSKPTVMDASGVVANNADELHSSRVYVLDNVVLIIKQTREAHLEIAELISKIENGDEHELDVINFSGPGGLGGQSGGFGGGGGFGSGFFSIPDQSTQKK